MPERPPYARMQASYATHMQGSKNHPCMGFPLLSHGLPGAMQGMQLKKLHIARVRK